LVKYWSACRSGSSLGYILVSMQEWLISYIQESLAKYQLVSALELLSVTG
jgi:hypothetical protein